MNTIDGIKYTNDSITLPLKLTVNEISSKTISDIKTDMATKIGVPLSLANADKAFTNVYGAKDRIANYETAFSYPRIEFFFGKAMLYIDTDDNKLKVFTISEQNSSGGSSSSGGTTQP